MASCCQESEEQERKIRGRQKEIWSIVSMMVQSGLQVMFPGDLVNCFYDDAILPAGDVQGNDRSERAKGPVGSCITCGWKKKCCARVGFVHCCFRFLL